MGFSNKIASMQSPQPSGGKGNAASDVFGINQPQQNYQSSVTPPQPDSAQGKGASGQKFTYSPTSGQPQMGSPNQYTNTVGGWDNASIQQPAQRGKGKGG